MIASGLALLDPKIDPKWPQGIKDEMRHMQFAAEEARAKQLYVYGAGRIPVIDDVIASGANAAP